MKKFIIYFVFLLLNILIFNSKSFAGRIYGCSALTGGGSGALDALDITGAGSPNANNLANGDLAIVVLENDATYGNCVLKYVFDVDSTSAESEPSAIRPDDYSSGGVWEISKDASIGMITGIPKGGGDGTYAAAVANTDYAAASHASRHNDGGADEIDRYVEGIAIQTFGSGDATPDITNGTTQVHRLWQVHQSTTPTITDFDDVDNHSEFSDGDWFVLIVNYGATIDFSSNSNIEGNSNVDFTGSSSQIVIITFIFEGTQWKSDLHGGWSNPTTLSVGAIETPTLQISELDDTSDPYLLVENELKGKILSNSESVGADEWDFPARGEGWDFCFRIEVAQNVTLDPNGTEQWYFNGTQMAAGEAIVNTSPTVGEVICCQSTEDDVFCDSKYTDFAEETP